ncbi:hypothetical protein BD626DRAFT_477068 [Schizophyllum amplum]|uniref:Uncharacterized protein n=1 Tax=Schizophyllum amplum TaxID=97359 RepID=A0A550CZW3_9AGAR|nr:hypothetical protein BD626DRAFT_477068 [Auriculariopsis ampla]
MSKSRALSMRRCKCRLLLSRTNTPSAVQLSGQFLLDLPMGAMRELGDHDVQHESSLVCQLRACCQSFTYSVIFGPPFNANMLLSADRRLESQDGPAPSQAAAAPISKVNGTKSNTGMITCITDITLCEPISGLCSYECLPNMGYDQQRA